MMADSPDCKKALKRIYEGDEQTKKFELELIKIKTTKVTTRFK